ncbi:MAG: SIMPL domain-containing protein [Planctomycetales bacterium]|nr:SIMPL domain-containing protein [Planctomycetales bacterium]
MTNDKTTRVTTGIKVFGSAIIRVAPDVASIAVAVTRLEKQPKDAFSKAHTGARAVHDYLKAASIDDVRSSRITLTQEHQYRNGENKFLGYQAKLGYSIVVRDLDRVEELLIGLIEAGANELTSVTFETSRLKVVREDARKRAIAAAREKASVYAIASGVAVGEVILIEDMNPEMLSGRYEGHVHREPVIDDPGDVKAVDPGAITVGAAVNVLFEIKR